MLETILNKYFNLSLSWNDYFEKEEKNWNESYNKLIDLINDLDKLGVITQKNEIIKKLDIINNMEV